MEKKKKKVATNEQQETKEEVTPTTNEAEQEEKEPVTEEQKIDQWQDKYIRLAADFDNYKKRTQKESASSYGNGVSSTVEALLPVIDNFDRAVLAIEESDESNLAEGIKMIYKQLKETLEKLGVEVIPALGKTFDPNLHNAVMHVEDENFGENEITEEFLRGYKLKDKVIRHSMVKVAN